MASVNDYLKKLLYQYDCVVVPELGAFLTRYQSATFTENSGLYLPPRKRVAFNEALRFDDGILANYIMLHEPVTREGAQRHVSLFVGELRQQVEASGRFDLDGIGTFTRNAEGKLQFDPSLRHNFFGEAYGMDAIAAQVTVGTAVEAVVVNPSTMAVGPVLSPAETPTLTPYRRSLPYWRVAAAALLVGSLGFISYLSVIKPGQPLQSSIDPSNLLRVPNAWLVRSTNEKKTVPPTVIPKAASEAPTAVAKSSLTAPVVKPVTVAAVPVVAAKPVPVVITPVATTEAEPIRTEPHFTVVAGSFSSKRNALGLRRQLRKAGYKDAFIITPSQKGQLYKVAAAGSADRAVAISHVAAISELAGVPAWIYKN